MISILLNLLHLILLKNMSPLPTKSVGSYKSGINILEYWPGLNGTQLGNLLSLADITKLFTAYSFQRRKEKVSLAISSII